MKNKAILILFFAINYQIFGATKITSDSSTVSNIQLEETDSKTLINKFFKKIIAFSPDINNMMTYQRIVENGEKRGINNINFGTHPFVASVYLAFAYHKNLTISPDIIWLLICQGASVHINLNKSQYKNYFSKNANKETIKVTFNNLKMDQNDTNWIGVIKLLSEELSTRIDSNLFRTYTANFTTSGPVEKTAFQLTLLNSVKNYYDYEVVTLCGIPEIEVLGTREDWTWMYDNVDKFNVLGLGWWTKELKPILKEFINAFDGNIDKAFWCSILKSKGGSGLPLRVTGWVKTFFPYVLNDRNRYIRNEYIGMDDTYNNPYSSNDSTTRPMYYAYHYKWNTTGLRMTQFTNGVQETPFTWRYFTSKFKMKFYSGFIGVSYDHTTGFLKPEIGYLVGKR